MIESIKNRLWEVLQSKEVSLAMLYDRDGRILWHRGRAVRGRSIAEGEGFSRSLIERMMSEPVEAENVVVTLSGAELPQSARVLYLRSVLVLPVHERYSLYLDSGVTDTFTPADREVFRLIGRLLGDTLSQITDSDGRAGTFCGRSAASQRVREMLSLYALEEDPVLLLGETGVGKNHVAEMIHRFSGRRGPFVVLHTPALPENLVESELFGHRRGAFTGAEQDREGLIGAAAGGTLLFDEIAEVPLPIQAKLLRFLDTGLYRVLGESRERTATARLIAASNRNLEVQVKAGRFRSDLYYRLSVLPVVIPPLRERPEDIPDLVREHERFLRGKRPGPGFIAALQRHAWPGNVRELIHVLKRAGIELPGSTIGGEVAGFISGASAAAEPAEPAAQPAAEASSSARSFWEGPWRRFLDREWSRKELRAFLDAEFERCGGSLKALARRLNIEESDYARFVSALHKYRVRPGK